MTKKQNYSLRKSKLGLVPVLVGLTIVGAGATVGTEVHAAEETSAATENQTESKVTEKQIEDAKKVETEAKNAVDKQNNNVSAKENTVNEATRKEKEAQDAVKKAEGATPEAVNKAKAEVAKKDTELADAKKVEADETLNVNKAKTEVSIAQNEEKTAQSGVNAAKNKEKEAQDNLDSLRNGRVDIKSAEENYKRATEAVNTANAEKAKADNELTKAKAEDATAATNLKNAQDEKTKAEQDLKNLGEKPKGYDFSDVKFTLGKELADAFKKRAQLMGENDPDNTGEAKKNELSTRNQAEVTDNANDIKRLTEAAKKANTYSNKKDTRQVNLWNLTAEEKEEINLFGLTIVNQIRKELGNPEMKTTVGMQKFADEAADNRNNNPEYRITTQARQAARPGNERISTHYYKGINDAAKVNGLSYKTDNNQGQSDLARAEIKVRNDKNELVDALEVSKNYTKEQGKQPIENVMKDMAREPIMTMGQLKEYIYEGYKNMMFVNQNSGDRSWEMALSVGGSIAYRKDGVGNKLGRQASIYNATSVSAGQVFNDVPYTNQWGENRYFNTFEIYVHNFQTAGENKNPGQENNAIVLDPSKFDATEIKNDPSAVTKYNNDKAKLDAALEKANQDLTKAQSYKSKVSEAQDAVNKATTALNDAKKAEKDAQDRVNALRGDQDNKAAAIKKAQDELETAQEAVKKAGDALTSAKKKTSDAQNNLASANNSLAKAGKDVADKQLLLQAAQKDLQDLENASNSLAKAKKDAENAKTNRETAEKELVKARGELVALQANYKNAQEELARLLALYAKQNKVKPTEQEPLPDAIVTERLEERETNFEVEEVKDPTLKKGQRVVKVKGEKGKKTVKVFTVTVNGEVVDTYEEIVSERAANNEVVLIGTKEESLRLPEIKSEQKNVDQREADARKADERNSDIRNSDIRNSDIRNSDERKVLPKTNATTTTTTAGLGLIALVGAAVAARRKNLK